VTQSLEIIGRGDVSHQVLTIFNNGNGHITGGDETGSFNNGTGFFNVTSITIAGFNTPALPLSVYYFQQGDPYNPSGDQRLGLRFEVFFAPSSNSFYANLNGHAIKAGSLAFVIEDNSGGNDAIAINATGVNIAAGAAFGTFVLENRLVPGSNGTVYFVMNWSGVNSGDFLVQGDASAYSDVALGLMADFLGAPAFGTLPGKAGGGSGSGPDDLSFIGGFGQNDLAMLLHGAAFLHPTGDLYGGTGQNFCNRTANVRTHGNFIQNRTSP
jgi:hypothetical protein